MFKIRYEHNTLSNPNFSVGEYKRYTATEGLNPLAYKLTIRVFGFKVWSV